MGTRQKKNGTGIKKTENKKEGENIRKTGRTAESDEDDTEK